jgi:integrase
MNLILRAMRDRIDFSKQTAKRAKIIPIPDQQTIIGHVAAKRHGTRNCVLALLSLKAGLRACEIAGLDWSMVLDAGGHVGDTLEISKSIAKKGSGRRIPLNRQLRAALDTLHIEQARPQRGPVCRSERGGAMTAKSVVNWFSQQYRELGFEGCSSHSGRRTMITLAARALAQVGGSLRDVQELAGHRNLTTTEGYIEGDRAEQRQLLELL